MKKFTFMIYLLPILIPISVVNIACSDNSKNTSALSQETHSLSNSILKDFRFEDFQENETEKVSEKISQAFPIDSDLALFISKMESLGAENRRGDSNEGPKNQIYYYYESGKGLVRTVWIIGAKHNEDKKIKEITVKSGLVGP